MTRHLPEQARRQQILTAARRCFIDNGYHPTRMDDIAKAADLSKGGVYFHFSSKQEVFESLVKDEFEESMRFLEGIAAEDKPVMDKMQVIAGHYLEYFNKAPDAPRFMIVMGEMCLRDEALAKLLLEMQTTFIKLIAKLLDQGVAEGKLRPTNTYAVAAILKGLLDGVEGLNALGLTIEAPVMLATGLDLVINGLSLSPEATPAST